MVQTDEILARFSDVDSWIHARCRASSDGSIRSWYSETPKDGSYPYPEIVGYYLTYEAWRKRTNSKPVLEVAQWLTSGSGGVRIARPSEPNVEYVFDAGIIASGLFSVAENTGMREYADIANSILEPIVASLVKTGTIPTILTGTCARTPTWSTRGRAHLVKIVQALLKNGSEEAYRAADALIIMGAKALSTNDLEEFSGIDGKLYLHPMLYAAEGFWIWSSKVGDPKTRTISELIYRRAENIIIEDAHSNWSRTPERGNVAWRQGDVLSQLCRLSGLLQIEMRDPSLMENIRLLTTPTGEAVSYTSETDHQNTWATIFYAQALAAQLAPDMDMTISWKDIA